MLYPKNYRFSFFFFAALFFSQLSFGQLSNFTLQVTSTNETCTANGSLSFSVTNTTPGSTFVYTIYHLPNIATPISVQNTTSFTGLVAGNYRVVATQFLGNESGTQQQDVTIVSQIVLLTYQLYGNNEICGADGKISVMALTGTPVSYEIFAGPILRPLQSSNVFTDLVAGQYSVRVFDACGEGVVQNFTIFLKNHELYIEYLFNTVVDCDTINITNRIWSAYEGGAIASPLSVQYIVHPPGGGGDIIYNAIENTSAYNPYIMNQDIIFFPNQLYDCDVIITDACGDVYSRNIPIYVELVPTIYTEIECGLHDVFIQGLFTGITLITTPTGYTGPLTCGALNAFYDLPEGNYTFTAVNVCGDTISYSFFLLNSITYPEFDPNVSCEIGYASVRCINLSLQSVIITAAPSTFNQTLPYDVSFNITSDGEFYMNSLPAGTYTFNTTDSCGIVSNTTIILHGLYDNTVFNIIQNCGSFDVQFVSISSNIDYYNYNYPHYYLQKYDPINNHWGNPLTGILYYGGVPYSNNSIELNSSAINYNYGFTGAFRILKSFQIYGNGTQAELCYKVIYEFEFSGRPKINDVYSFLCNNSTYDVLVDATGIGPLIYRITQKNGQPFVIENGNSSAFLGLPAAIYNFQVEDACGNILNSLFEVPRPFNFVISPHGLCEGLPGSLNVPNFSILQYQWWKDSASTTILSTTSSLPFPAFNLTTNAGVYHVRVRYTGNPNSCIDFVLDYTISATPVDPNAGQDGAITYCGSHGTIDLFTLLAGTFDTNGVWDETSYSGALVANMWNSTAVTPGDYQFKYRVNGICTDFDESFVTITIKPIPEMPVAFLEQVVCDTHSLNLLATTIPNGIYEWTGPNGFSSNEQNPTINTVSVLNNGIYTVKSLENGCESEVSSVEVLVAPSPQFTLGNACIEDAYTLTATVVNNPGTAPLSFSWTGPNNYASAENPINITGLIKGDYFLTVTNADGCSFTDSVHVLNTLCVIQQGVSVNDDGDNDTLNLLGFDVKNLKIFNRYGMIVYEQDNYINQWHGQDYNNNELPGATYYYQVTLPTGVIKTGWVYLIRK